MTSEIRTFKIRAIVEDELDTFIESVVRGFGGEVQEGEQDRVREVIGFDRCRATFDERNRMVGTTASYSLSMTVPGGLDVPTAGLTRVVVAASHRRRGILTAMMEDHLDEAAASDEPLSALWASEAAIYGRFGYGQATENVTIKYDGRLAKVRPPAEPDIIDMVDATEAQKIIPDVRERSRLTRPGQFHRSDRWWEHRAFPDHEWMRDGASPRRYVIATRDGSAVGYAAYRQKEHWTDNDIPEGTINLVELSGVDTTAVHSLWWFLSNIDLFPKVSAWLQPPDCIVPWVAGNPRAVVRNHTDGIHLRVLDTEAAFSARRYDIAGSLTFAVEDEFRPGNSGVYQLTIDDDGVGICRRSDAEPEATINGYGLGALYLGGTRPEPLALNGDLKADPATIAHIRRLLSWPIAPYCDEGF